MSWFTRNKAPRLIDVARVRDAIVAAERTTSAELRVSLAPWFWGSVERAADKAFVRLGMTATKEHNGVLFFVVPSRRAFVVLGDSAVHDRLGQAFWDELAAILSAHFARGEFTQGLLAALARAGQQLAAKFPPDSRGERNELPDEVDVQR
jgi:uncharacterized membrane protein